MFKDNGFHVVKTIKDVQLSHIYSKVLNFSTAINNTFVLFGMRGFREDCITHFTEDGKLLG